MSLAQFAVAGAALTLVLAIDQLAKAGAERILPEAPRPAASPLRFEVVRNDQAGFGRIAVSRSVRAAVGALAAAAGMTLVLFGGPLSTLSALGLGMAIGGAAGNVMDLLTRGHVIDFVSIGRWPTFNLADVALCCGLAMAAIGLT